MKKETISVVVIITVLFVVTVCILLFTQDQWTNALPLYADTIQNKNQAITADGKININTASVEDLSLLSGIGTVLAQRIVQYRDENGPYLHVSDLLKVKGIGPEKLNKIISIIAVG